MYQLEYLDLEENNTYEEIIKKVVEQCFKEEKLEQMSIEKQMYYHFLCLKKKN